MKAETIFEVIMKLIGQVRPVGDSSRDAERKQNMEVFIRVFDEMHTVLDGVAYNFRDSARHSEKEIAKLVDDYMTKTFEA